MPAQNRKIVHVTLSEPAYVQLKMLAIDTGRTVPGYIRYLIHQEFATLDLPLCLTPAVTRRQADP